MQYVSVRNITYLLFFGCIHGLIEKKGRIMYRFGTRKLVSLIAVSVVLCSCFSVAFNLKVSFSNVETVDIMPLGDSITVGYPGEVGYRQKLYLDLTNAGFDVDFVGSQSNGTGFDADHEGHGGAEAWELNTMLNSPPYYLLPNNPPDIILYHIGTNSLYAKGIGPTQAALDANKSLEIIYGFNSSITVILAKIINTTNSAQNDRTHTYNLLLEEYAQSWSNLGYHIKVVNMTDALNYIDDMADWLHPNAAGYAKMADVWYDALDDILPISVYQGGMISYWKMDDTSIPPIVDSFDGRDGTNVSGVPTPSTGIVNGALYFDGGTEVDVPDTGDAFDWTRADSFTVELWMKTTANLPNNVMVGRDDWPVHWWVGVFGNAANFIVQSRLDPYVYVTGTTLINDGVWHHIVAVRDRSEGKIRIYVDGLEEKSADASYTSDFSSTVNLNIGYLHREESHYRYTGFLDEIAVYDKALTPSEILQHYNNGWLLGKGYLEGQQVGFDFGTGDSPVEAGYFQVTESTLYSASLGYGWNTTSGLDSIDRGAPDNLRRDFVFSSTEHTFTFDLENGDYQVTVIIGDQDQMHDQIDVYAEDILKINDLVAAAGTFQEVSFGTKVADGQLNITILDDGGTDPYWVINTMTIEALGFPLHVGVNPTSWSMNVGQSQLFTAIAYGGTPPYSYAWYLDSELVTGAGDPTWTFAPSSAGTYQVYANVTDDVSDEAQSNIVSVTVSEALSVSVTPASVSLVVGQPQLFTATASGGTPPYSYAWYLDSELVSGAEDSTWTFTPESAGDYEVYANVTDSVSDWEQSNTASITVSPAGEDAYLLLSVEPNQATYTLGQSLTFTVNVFSEFDFSDVSLTFTVTGPGEYYVFDFERINMAADAVREYSFEWTVPDVAGTYVVEVCLVPPLLTAYDAMWLEVA